MALPRPDWALFKEPAAALAYFRAKVPTLSAAWKALDAAARSRAFTVAGIARLDILSKVWKSLDGALATGEPFEDWKKRIGTELERGWRGSVANPASRIETIFRTNAQTAYAAGRAEVATDPVIIQLRPFWMYDSTVDGRTSGICRARHKTVLPADDPWWGSNHPPLHHNCRSAIITLRRSQAVKAGISAAPPVAAAPPEGFGLPPKIDGWKPNADAYPAPLWIAFEGAPKPRDKTP